MTSSDNKMILGIFAQIDATQFNADINFETLAGRIGSKSAQSTRELWRRCNVKLKQGTAPNPRDQEMLIGVFSQLDPAKFNSQINFDVLATSIGSKSANSTRELWRRYKVKLLKNGASADSTSTSTPEKTNKMPAKPKITPLKSSNVVKTTTPKSLKRKKELEDSDEDIKTGQAEGQEDFATGRRRTLNRNVKKAAIKEDTDSDTAGSQCEEKVKEVVSKDDTAKDQSHEEEHGAEGVHIDIASGNELEEVPAKGKRGKKENGAIYGRRVSDSEHDDSLQAGHGRAAPLTADPVEHELGPGITEEDRANWAGYFMDEQNGDHADGNGHDDEDDVFFDAEA